MCQISSSRSWLLLLALAFCTTTQAAAPSFKPTKTPTAVPTRTPTAAPTLALFNINTKATSAGFKKPVGVWGDSNGNLYVADKNANYLFKVNSVNAVSPYAGTGSTGAGNIVAGLGSPGLSSALSTPYGVWGDNNGNIYVSSQGSTGVVFHYDPSSLKSIAIGGGTGLQDGMDATSIKLSVPTGVFVDLYGNLYVSDSYWSVVIKIGYCNNEVLIMGGTKLVQDRYGDGGPATSAAFNQITAIWGDSYDSLYVADNNNFVIRKITYSTGIITTAIGNGNVGWNGDTVPVHSVAIREPQGIAGDNWGNMYFVDGGNYLLRMVVGGETVVTLAGRVYNGTNGVAAPYLPNTVPLDGNGGPSTSGVLYEPWMTFVDSTGKIYVTESASTPPRVRVISPNYPPQTTAVPTPSGSAPAAFCAIPSAIPTYSPTFVPTATPTYVPTATPSFIPSYVPTAIPTYVPTATPTYLPTYVPTATPTFEPTATPSNTPTYVPTFFPTYQLVTYEITTVAGNGGFGYDGCYASAATGTRLNFPVGVTLDTLGDLYISDSYNQRVRKSVGGNLVVVTDPVVSPDLTIEATALTPYDVTSDTNGVLYVADFLGNKIFQVGLDHTVTLLIGGGTNDGTDVPPLEAEIQGPSSIVYILEYNALLFTETVGNRLTALISGIVSRFVGVGGAPGYNGDGVGTSVLLNSPRGLWYSSSQSVAYFTDSGNNLIRTANVNTAAVVTVIGTGSAAFSGEGTSPLATNINYPIGIYGDSQGFIYFTDTKNNRVRKFDPYFNVIYTIAGTGSVGYSGDGGPGTSATISNANLLEGDTNGNLYWAEFGNSVIRKLIPIPV